MNWEQEEVVVTGGAGFIGSHLVDVLWQRGVRMLTVVDDLRRGCLDNLRHIPKVYVEVLDLHDGDQIDHLAALFEGAIVFHLAARVTNIQENRYDHLGMLQDNLRINANVIQAAIPGRMTRGPKLFEATSTVCVYPHDAPIPTMESAGFPFHPEDTNEGYGLAKAILEKQAEYLHREHGIPVFVPRFANAFGPRDYYDQSSHVVPALIRKAHEDEEIVVWGSGRQSRTLMDARDLAEILVRLAEEPRAHDAQPINLGWADAVTIRDLVWKIQELSGQQAKRIRFDRSKPDGHLVREFCNSRLIDLIGYPPCRALEETLADMIAEYQAGRAHL